MGYIQGELRSQTSMFPVSLAELIPEDLLVRVIDLYVSKLDLVHLGFDKAQPKATGRPSYDPADQLKLYLYGYFQRTRSSRRLEAERQSITQYLAEQDRYQCPAGKWLTLKQLLSSGCLATVASFCAS